jgi:hypothetical protein
VNAASAVAKILKKEHVNFLMLPGSRGDIKGPRFGPGDGRRHDGVTIPAGRRMRVAPRRAGHAIHFARRFFAAMRRG